MSGIWMDSVLFVAVLCVIGWLVFRGDHRHVARDQSEAERREAARRSVNEAYENEQQGHWFI